MDTLVERFWAKVTIAEGCWEWTASVDHGGYGQIEGKRDGHRTMLKAHRVSWELHNGPVPPGLGVLHHCDNRICVNPAHLWVGTRTDNMRDAANKGRIVVPTNPIGEAHPRAKVTNELVRLIRAHRTGTGAMREFGLSRSTVYGIRSGERWGHIVPP